VITSYEAPSKEEIEAITDDNIKYCKINQEDLSAKSLLLEHSYVPQDPVVYNFTSLFVA
jgi:hypothetical protein